MRLPRIFLLASLLTLPLGFLSCNEKVQTSSPTQSEATEGGKISFRVSAAELVAIGPGIDSVRIDAVRAGYPTQSAWGSLSQTTLLEGLQSGPWTIQVALFDASQAVHWFGEAVVQVFPGKSVDAEVHLRKATGSVRVRIILDDPQVIPPPVPALDTVKLVPVSLADTASWADLPVGSVSRSDRGVFLETKYDCNVKPVVLQSTFADSGRKVMAFYPVQSRMTTMIACDVRPHILFIPITRDMDVEIRGLLTGLRIRLPGQSVAVPVVPVENPAFKEYQSLEYIYSSSRKVSLVLTPDGLVRRQISKLPEGLDTLPAPEFAKISPDSLAMIRRLLALPEVRKPADPYVCPVPTITRPADAPISTIQSRYVTYVDGVVSAQKLDLSQTCSYPISWLALNRVDAMLSSLYTWN
ncbi:MAG: hypothetical protein IPK50_15500 [Fibrobacterota bacterium]|nr:hypothetical protein [Fibrobacterota bacterium]QQS03698.1 MAG: hypothetical protein IPK50_15500 [Fibrobacterota bacterium]